MREGEREIDRERGRGVAFAQTRTGHSEDVLTFSLDVDDHKPHKLQSSKISSVSATTIDV